MAQQGQQAKLSRQTGAALEANPAMRGPVRGTPRQQARLLAGGVSAIALMAMLGTLPAYADPLPGGSVVITNVPSGSSSTGFVTAGSQQTNTGAAITATLSGATGSSSTIGNSGSPLPNAATVTGNDLSAYATGNAQTNGVSLATIGSSESANGIAVLAEQLNTNAGPTTALTTLNSNVGDSYLANSEVNATSGDALTSANNLIDAQVTGNIALSSVTGVLPTDYTGVSVAGTSSLSGTLDGAATGNVVVATSQKNNGIQAGAGSYAYLYHNKIGANVYTSSIGNADQSLALSLTQTGNIAAATFLGNSANNDIGVALTAGSVTGAGTLDGSLVVANTQTNHRGNTRTAVYGVGAYNGYSSMFAGVASEGDDNPAVTLASGSILQTGNTISSSATGNSATGAAGGAAPGNEITLGVNLNGSTTALQQNNYANNNPATGGGKVKTGADLALSSLQDANNIQLASKTEYGYIGSFAENATNSSIDMASNSMTASVSQSDVSNAIDTGAGAGINIISGLVGLGNVQAAYNLSSSYAENFHGKIEGYLGASGSSDISGSTLLMADNSMGASANVNQATNGISLSANIIDAGAGGVAAGPAGVYIASLGASGVAAGLSLNNEQESSASSYALLQPNFIYGGVNSVVVSNDAISMTNSSMLANATNNDATNSIDANGSTGVAGSIGLANGQDSAVGTTATVDNGDGGVEAALLANSEDPSITGSTGTLSGTNVSAEATDNFASNTLAASGGTLSNVSGTTGLAAQVNDGFIATSQNVADLALSSVQQDTGGPALAENGQTDIFVNADADGGTIGSSAFTVSGPSGDAPAIQALAIGQEALNSLSATASSGLSDTAGLLNTQSNDVGAGAVVSDAEIAVEANGQAGGDIGNSDLIVGSGAVGGSNGNVIRALSYANQASNTLLASTGGTLTVVATSGNVVGSQIPLFPPSDTGFLEDGSTGVGAAYGLLNDQSSTGPVDSYISASGAGIFMGNADFGTSLNDVAAETQGNALVASAFGNQVGNAGTIAAGNLSADSYYPVGDVTNVQSAGGPEVIAESGSTDGDSFTTQLAGSGDVTGSTLGVNANTSLTQAEDNQAANSLAVSANNITDVPDGPLSAQTVVAGLGASIYSAFSVQNVQYGGTGTGAGQTDTNALVSTGASVDGSSLTAENNVFQATAYNNNAANSLSFGTTDSPVNSLNASAGVQNVQDTTGLTIADLGAPGTAATPAVDIGTVDFTVPSGTNSAVISGDTLTVNGGNLVFNVGTLSPTQLTAFEALVPGGTLSGSDYTLDGAGATYTLPDPSAFTTDDGYLYLVSGAIDPTVEATNALNVPAVAGTSASPSVQIDVAGDITDSTLGVTGNAFNAMAVANNATNTLNIAATTVSGGANLIPGSAGGSVNGDTTTALADYAVSNVQSFEAPVSVSSFGEVAINPTPTSDVSGSSLILSGNSQGATAEGNVADNILTLSATNATALPDVSPAPSLALVSSQATEEDVGASAGTLGLTPAFGLVVTAPGGMDSSTLTMSNNSNDALAVANDVTNLVAVDATNLGGNDSQNATASIAEVPSASADYTLTNVQGAGDGAVTATAATQVLNSDSTVDATQGVTNSTVTIAGNNTAADAYVNRAANTLDMTAANSTATGALTNSQTSSDAVTATGAAQIGFALNGGFGEGPTPSALNSSIDVTGNTTQVQAVANQATNALNANTEDAYGPQAVASGDSTTASATYAVLNVQSNTGDVVASDGGTPTTYSVALSSGGSNAPVAGTTVSVSYNTAAVSGFGNSATNSMALSALNSGNATAALQNTQTNTGNVTASIANASFGVGIGAPGASGMATVVGNNSISASAVGNTATSSIGVVH